MEAGLQDRGMRIQGGRREETGNSSQASRHMKPGVGSILGGKGCVRGAGLALRDESLLRPPQRAQLFLGIR